MGMADHNALGGTLVLGGGFAGGYVARLLGKRGATIVSPENFMLYTPLLPEAASGTLEPRHVVVPLRLMCPHAELLLGRATGVDTEQGRVTVETEDGVRTLAYDELVVALGAISRTLPIPGLADHALGFKTLADAIHLRNHVLRRLEAASAATRRCPRSTRSSTHSDFPMPLCPTNRRPTRRSPEARRRSAEATCAARMPFASHAPRPYSAPSRTSLGKNGGTQSKCVDSTTAGRSSLANTLNRPPATACRSTV